MVTEAIRVPLRNPEFAPFIQRIKDAKPDAVFVFVPAGEQGVAFMKGYRERGLAEAGIKVIATGDLTDDHVLPAMGDATLGVITSFHYSAAHNSPENKAFLKNFADTNPGGGRPNFMAAAAYDGMGSDLRGRQQAERQDRWRQGDGGAEGNEDQQPARPDHDRPADARCGADRLHPQGGKGQWRVV
jgi:ABC-type branched-subunit amino acid transport system substrate-binding protein